MRINNVLMSIVIATSLSANAATPSYPQKPVKVIVPFTEGSATDVIARMVTAKRSVANHNNDATTMLTQGELAAHNSMEEAAHQPSV